MGVPDAGTALGLTQHGALRVFRWCMNALMTRRAMLWTVGLLALVVAYLSAASATISIDGSSICGGQWNIFKWVTSCEAILTRRLAILAVGVVVLIVCAYYAERSGEPQFAEEYDDDEYEDSEYDEHDEDEVSVAAPDHEPGQARNAPVEPEFKTCPDCAEQVRFAARKCRFCGYVFTDAPAGS